MRAQVFNKPDENLSVIYSDGTHLEFMADNTEFFGDWVIDPERAVDRVPVYMINKQTDTNMPIGEK